MQDISQIPNLIPVTAWQTVSIEECHEPLLPLSQIDPSLLVVDPAYYRQRIPGALPECYARETVADLLLQAAKQLPDGMRFLVWDCWRPIEVQRSLFDQFEGELRKIHPGRSQDDIRSLASVYVSVPNPSKTSPSPHYTGGAIDLSIIDSSGTQLDMGTTFDHLGPEASTRFYESLEQMRSLSEEEEMRKNNRRILFWALASVGFTNYHEEWWHFDYGNQFWAVIKRRVAIYGPVKPSENKSN